MMKEPTKFAHTLFKSHVEVAAWPKSMRAALSTGGTLVGSENECTRKGCPCHEAKRIMDDARARVTTLIDEAMER